MDQKTAAMIIVKFLRTVVYMSKVSHEDDTELCLSCGGLIYYGQTYCRDCANFGPCQRCGREIQFSDWAWTGHCSRDCATSYDRDEYRYR
jgi:hypothetical protein